jgi:hypothetical protein
MTREVDGKFGNQSTGVLISVVLLLIGVSMVIACSPMPKQTLKPPVYSGQPLFPTTPVAAKGGINSMLIPMTTWSVLALGAFIFFVFCYRNVQNQPAYLDIVNNKRTKWFSSEGLF